MLIRMQPVVYLCLALLAPSGCASTASKQISHKAKALHVSVQKPVLRAELVTHPQAAEIEARGDFLGAAREYLNLAQAANNDSRFAYQLQAINVLLRGKLFQQAANALNNIDEANLPKSYRLLYALSKAKIAMAQQRANDAINATAEPLPPYQSTPFTTEWYRLRAQAFDLLGDYVNAAREYLQLIPSLPTTEEVLLTQNEMWQILTKLSPTQLNDLNIGTHEEQLSGWRDLAIIAKSNMLPADVEQQIKRWQQLYLMHPASDALLQSITLQARKQSEPPVMVALLLPETGPLASTASAVRDGFLTAYNNSRDNNGYAPTLRTYNTSGQKINEVYQRAITDGAQFIVGPLEKDAVNALMQVEKLPVPTLALNYGTFDTSPPENLFQFGLSPEDEALQVAERAWLDGHNRAAIIVPGDEWGARILQAFKETWEKFGGVIVETQQFSVDTKDFSTPVKNLLNVDESELRFQQLRAYVKRDLQFEPQRRHDISFIFMAALPTQGRQIRPQLNYFFAGDIPVYATSHIFSGTHDALVDRDMNEVMFSDMPWVLDTAASKPLRDTIQRLWPDTAYRFERLYALGVDSFNLITQLPRLNAYRYERVQGETGNLGLDDSNHIRRQLLWARFIDGVPRLLDKKTAPNP